MTLVIKSLAVAGAAAAALLAVNLPRAAKGGTNVQLCDGETQLQLDAAPTTKEGGFAVAAALMAEWQRKHPDQQWQLAPPQGQDPRQPGKPQQGQDPEQGQPPRGEAIDSQEREALLRQRYQPKEPFDNRVLLGDGQKQGHPYRDFTERDILLWERETMRLVFEGAEVFHDAGRLGSTIAVSCDMCHPDASNTHPETYPKYQTQIGKPVVLRDMINWCIEHPVRGKPLAHDDPRMIALEAYIYAQRKGEKLVFGKH